jgi:hypothetical protein
MISGSAGGRKGLGGRRLNPQNRSAARGMSGVRRKVEPPAHPPNPLRCAHRIRLRWMDCCQAFVAGTACCAPTVKAVRLRHLCRAQRGAPLRREMRKDSPPAAASSAPTLCGQSGRSEERPYEEKCGRIRHPPKTFKTRLKPEPFLRFEQKRFGTPRVSVVLEAKSGAARKGRPPAKSYTLRTSDLFALDELSASICGGHSMLCPYG